ncbi:MAG: hypothetical protein AAF598_22365 [Bacteroidota bacterium]
MNKHSRKVTCPSDEEMRHWLQLMLYRAQVSLEDQHQLKSFQAHLNTCIICQSATAGLLKWLENEGRLPERKTLPDHLQSLMR